MFADRVLHPVRELLYSPPGETVYEQMGRGAVQLADRAAYAWDNPRSVIDGIAQGLDRANKNLNPYATPQGKTVAEEIARNWKIGLNQGELAFDVGSLAFGGSELKGLRLAMRGGRPLTAADMMARKIPANLADDFAQPYSGIGHHIIQKDFKPWWLGEKPVPEAIRQLPYFRLKPDGLTKGEFYKRHYEVDRHYNGGKTPAEFGGVNGKGRELGWEKRNGLGLLWYGSTPLMKAQAGGALGLGIGLTDIAGEENR